VARALINLTQHSSSYSAVRQSRELPSTFYMGVSYFKGIYSSMRESGSLPAYASFVPGCFWKPTAKQSSSSLGHVVELSGAAFLALEQVSCASLHTRHLLLSAFLSSSL